jgi:hypothetical protein
MVELTLAVGSGLESGLGMTSRSNSASRSVPLAARWLRPLGRTPASDLESKLATKIQLLRRPDAI